MVRNSDGPGVLAHGLRTERDLIPRTGVHRGRGEIGAIGMNDARIGARLNTRGAKLRNPTGPALPLDGLQTTRDVAQVGGTLHLTDAVVTSRSAPDHRWALDGLDYAGVPRLAEEGNRMAWLDS